MVIRAAEEASEGDGEGGEGDATHHRERHAQAPGPRRPVTLLSGRTLA
jgi:hypothetical protein